MKKLVAILAVGVLAFVALPSSADAQGDPTTVWADTLNNGSWDQNWAPGDPTALARLFKTGSPIDSACNKSKFSIDIVVHASVAQWIDWNLTHQGWTWQVKKPGCYAGNSISFVIASNGDVLIDYEMFNDLTATTPNNHIEEIPTYYSFGETIAQAEAAGWVRAIDLNSDDDLLDETELSAKSGPFDLHNGITFKLWNKICTVESNSACEYEDQAKVLLCLLQQKSWLDENGDWAI